MLIKVKIDEDFLQSFGSNSLLGYLAKNHVTNKDKIELVFPQTTFNYKKKHGPKDYIVVEHNIPCLLKDILYLKDNGYEIKISTPEILDS